MMTLEVQSPLEGLDKLGIGLSVLCLFHCALLPIVITFLPFIETELGDVVLHGALLALIAPVAIVSWLRGLRNSRRYDVLCYGVFGLGVLVAALWVPEGVAHSVVTSVGGVFVVLAHWYNMKFCCKKAK